MNNINFSRLIGLIFLIGRLVWIAKADATELPSCTASESTACGDATNTFNHCIGTDNKIFKTSGSTCVGAYDSPADGVYKAFKCSSEKVCDETTDYTGSILVYKYTSSSWSQYTLDYYHVSDKLFSCGTNTPCTLVTTAGYYYLTSTNSNLSDELIKVDASSNAAKVNTEGNYYLAANSGGVTANTLITIASGGALTAKTSGFTAGNYLDEVTKGDSGYTKIISCTATTCQLVGTAGFYKNSGTDASTNPYIECDGTKCESKAPSADGTYYYLDQGSEDSGTVKGYLLCKKTSSTVSCDSKTVTGTDTIILLNSAVTGIATKGLLSCSSAKCEAIDGSGYYINGDTDNKILIKCESSGCSKVESPSTNGSYLDGVQTGGKNTNVITCATATTCESTTGNGIYLNADTSDNSKIIITCTDTGCTEGAGAKGNVYLDASSKVGQTTNYKKLIICTNATTCTSQEYTSGNYVNTAGSATTSDTLITCATDGCYTGAETGNYINAGADDDKTITLITCANSSCSAEAGEDGGVYIDASSKDSGKFKNLIKCTTAEGCKSEGASPGVFLDANTKSAGTSATYTNLITCGTDSQCNTDVGGDGNYVNDGDTTTNTLITCTSSSCSAGTGVNGDFYLNKGVDKDTNQLIKCESNGCTGQQIETAGNYLDGYTYVAADGGNPATYTKVITCNTVGSATTITCDNTTAVVSDGSVYINAGSSGSADILIICTSGTSGVTCSVADGAANDYYVNAGVDKDTKQLINCSAASTCDSLSVDTTGIYLDAFSKDTTTPTNYGKLIICTKEGESSVVCKAEASKPTKDKYQYYLNTVDTIKDLTDDLIKCSLNDDNKNVCIVVTGEEGKVYVNSYNTTEVIYCDTSKGCGSKASTAKENIPQFFVNGGDLADGEKLDFDLIKCAVKGGKITCNIANGKNGDVYLNGIFVTDDIAEAGDAVNQLIICTTDNGCEAKAVSIGETSERKREEEEENTEEGEENESEEQSPPKYYLNAGNEGKDKFANALIQCAKDENDEITCDLYKADPYKVYLNSNDNEAAELPLIKCVKNSCNKAVSTATKDSKEFYINGGDVDDTPKNYDIIECALSDNVISCTTKTKDDTKDGVYINSNYSVSGDSNQLIKCSSDDGCVGIKIDEKAMEYYVNAESDSLSNAIIFCSKKKCQKQTPASVPMYFVGKDGNEVDGLIKCVNAPVTSDEKSDDSNDTSKAEKRDEETKDQCILETAFTSEGYYLNSGYNKAVNQTIICDSTEGCGTVKVDLGYYVNAGNDNKKIIKCEKQGSECVEEANKSCPEATVATPGSYCYEEGQLKFFTAGGVDAVAASKSDDLYAFATIPSNGFPGIKVETGSLFKISRYYIIRFTKSGVVMIDKNGKLVDSLDGDQSEISIYDCDETTKICTERLGCVDNTYMFDSENAKAIFCNNGNLEYAKFTGYVVDGTRIANGSKHPFIIYCEGGEKCTSIKSKTSTYYKNSGYDSNTNSLIQCQNKNCVTVPAEAGYYVAQSEDESNGVIKCTSATTCAYTPIKGKVKFVNAGFDKKNNAIIKCEKGRCAVDKAKSGYYLTHTSTLLIQCTSPTSCNEFIPTANYYDNADSSESNNTIINCVQNSNVVTCSTEATNNGFYMSSLSNVLIRCKSDSKCKRVTVKNGFFRGALKGLTSGHKRSDENGKNNVKVRDSGDDAYGIIRCVAGKCAALSASELAAIPMCEFNNNKCYITLEYSMTKAATTSITAGNICTNSDRSVFYFATDTVVVKPNVISGVTSTYVYTTTNTNCLEVNDSYNDMFFTVGSNIYTLDQGSVFQFYETGYYFINVAKNTLVTGNNIDDYNDENVKLYRCNGSSCSVVDKPNANAYVADVNKRILEYNINNEVYSFAYEKDITCIFANNKCTPNADLKNHEFCITYKGEIVLATTDILNRETGECYRAGNINNYIYGYSQHLYQMNQFSAEMVDKTGFYIVSLATNTTVVSKNYKTKNSNIVVYGCKHSSCRVYEPDEDVYYYDAQAMNILRYRNGAWSSPSTSGYAYIALSPTDTYIYRFEKNGEEITIKSKAKYGYYYTVDNEMYHCDEENDECYPIDDSGYYFTNTGEVYYCVHDSEELEPTECVKQNCITGQYYYIDDAYYRCDIGSILAPVVSRYCSYDDQVIVNFPLALTEELPGKIKLAVDNIQKNNNSTAVVTRRGKNILESVSGIFTNCTYNVEETKSDFDLVCVNNYVSVDEDTNDVKICSVEQLGYVDCVEDNENPQKCSISGAVSTVWKPSLFTLLILFFITALFQF